MTRGIKRIDRYVIGLMVAILLMLQPVGAFAFSGAYATLKSPSTNERYNVLFIGNSFSNDTTQYLYDIATEAGYELYVGNAYIGGTYLKTVYDNIFSNAQEFHYRVNQKGHWSYRRNDFTQKWSLAEIIKVRNWDAVIIQPNSIDAGNMEAMHLGGDEQAASYPELIAYWIKSIRQDIAVGYNMTWALSEDFSSEEYQKLYQGNQETMYQKNCQVTQAVTGACSNIDFVIPTGTAIQNARSSYLGDKLNRDGKHLDMGIGRYLAGMTAAASLGIPVEGLSMMKLRGDNYASPLHLKVMKSCVEGALENPYEVTKQNQEKPALGQLDLNVTKQGKSITLSWSTECGASGYKIKYLCPGKSSYRSKTLKSHASSFTFKGKKGYNSIQVEALGDAYMDGLPTEELSVYIGK